MSSEMSSSSNSTTAAASLPEPTKQMQVEVANYLREAADEKHKLEEVNKQRAKELSDLNKRLADMEEMLQRTQGRLKEYDTKEKEKLKNRIDNVVNPYLKALKEAIPSDDALRPDVEMYEKQLYDQIEKPTNENLSDVRPAVSFVTAVASAAQIQSRKLEELFQREKQLLDERDAKVKELEEVSNTAKEREEELAKLKAEMEELQKKYTSTSTNIANVEGHFDRVQKSELEGIATEVNPTEQESISHLQEQAQTVTSIASGQPGTGGFSDLYNLGSSGPSTNWRSIGNSIDTSIFPKHLLRDCGKENFNQFTRVYSS